MLSELSPVRQPTYDTKTHPVIDSSHITKAFLTRNVPKLQSNSRAFFFTVAVFDDLKGEIDAYRRSVVFREKIVNVALDEGRFARAEFADHENLEEEFLLHLFLVFV